MHTRRRFLQQSALLSLSPLVPDFLTASVSAAAADDNRNILVVIQLSGGNDGINTVVPFEDEGYAGPIKTEYYLGYLKMERNK